MKQIKNNNEETYKKHKIENDKTEYNQRQDTKNKQAQLSVGKTK